ncbi:MAG: TolC family protein [Pyrinomonadaceae bacterium]
MLINRFKTVVILTAAFFTMLTISGTRAQTLVPQITKTVINYLDQATGQTADDIVTYALAHNDELEALQREVEASEALVRQARLRANPSLEIGGAKNPVTPSKSVMVKGSLPLELFGRRPARVKVAEEELAVRRQVLADRERMLAAEVRAKFGETLALALKLQFADETVTAATENYNLVVSRVGEGRTAPLEQNMVLVELNRIRAIRETSEGRVEISMLELRNMIGMRPEEPMRLRGEFMNLLDPLAPQEIAVDQALGQRPDLQMSRAIEDLSQARIDQARSQGKLDASVNAGYQRMRQGFPQSGFNDLGQVVPIGEIANVFTVGVMLELPLFNRNQGTIEAAVLEKTAAQNRTAFGELTVRREVAVAYTRYKSAARAMEIYRIGVEKQAETNLEVVRQTYELGARTLLDFIAEQRRYIEIKDGFIDTQLDTYLARVEILRATNAPELKKK